MIRDHLQSMETHEYAKIKSVLFEHCRSKHLEYAHVAVQKIQFLSTYSLKQAFAIKKSDSTKSLKKLDGEKG